MINFIPKIELKTRQDKVRTSIPENSALLIFSNQLFFKNSDVEFAFRQDSNFWYFTGLDEDESAVLFLEGKIILFAREKDEFKELWGGQVLGLELAKDTVNADEVYPFSKLVEVVTNKLKGLNSLYFDVGGNSFRELRNEIKIVTQEFKIEVKPELQVTKHLRWFKSSWEIEQMQKASNISVLAHKKVKQYLSEYGKISSQNELERLSEKLSAELDQVGLSEAKIESILAQTFIEFGTYSAYPSIVASGKNLTTIHYYKNTSKFTVDDLVLIDAACEYNYYSSDITRVYKSKPFTTAEKEIYDLALKANIEVIDLAKDYKLKNLAIHDLHDHSVKVVSQGLIDLGIIKSSLDETIETKSYKKYFPYGTSHWLGLDTHDQGNYRDESGDSIKLQSGMAFTVEPGLIMFPNDENIPSQYKGLGVRVEDDIVLTDDGIINLTQNLEK